MTRWEPVIGLEVHVQLDTASKAFSASAVQFGARPNSLTDPTVLGLPGSLPVFNQRALELALRLGIATACQIRARSRFARKQFFYPDMPKGYQISQYDEPLCEHGALEILVGEEIRKIRLTRIHLEEDAGKNTHHGGASLVDLNRCGVPLCEIVSEPDLRSAEEAAEYMRALRLLVRYLGISGGDMEKGQLRCDANVSLREVGTTALGTRTELKNINSFKFVQRAIEHEIERQAAILDGGDKVVQETRLWDADRGLSQSMRSKEEANDYRYFPDPDLPPLVVDGRQLGDVRAALPELPLSRYRRLVHEHGLNPADARALIAERELVEFYDAALATGRGVEPRTIAGWVLSELLGALHRDQRALVDSPVSPDRLAALTRLIGDGTISGKIAKDVFAKMYATGDHPRDIVDREGLRQITDDGAIEAIARAVVEAHPEQAASYRGGKTKLLGFFVGKVMKETGGKANPQATSEILKRLLG